MNNNFEAMMKWSGWRKTDNQKPRNHEYVRVSKFPFIAALYCEYGDKYVFHYGRRISCNPTWWRHIKGGDCLIRDIERNIDILLKNQGLK